MKIDFKLIIYNHWFLFYIEVFNTLFLNTMIKVKKFFIKVQTYNVIYFDHKCTRNLHINDMKSKMTVNCYYC